MHGIVSFPANKDIFKTFVSSKKLNCFLKVQPSANYFDNERQ